MISEDTQYMHHDARDERGPYTAIHAEGPWYCMVPEGVVDVPLLLLRSGGVLHAKEVTDAHMDVLQRVAWASERSLREGLRPGLHGEVGWLPVVPF